MNPSTTSSEMVEDAYEELRALAARQFGTRALPVSLRPTELVHETVARLLSGAGEWRDRAHFIGAFVTTMKRVVIDRARRRNAQKRNASVRSAEGLPIADGVDLDNVLQLVELLDIFAARHPVKAQVVHLRVFGRFTTAETAEMLGISHSTVDNYWVFAKAWLRVRM